MDWQRSTDLDALKKRFGHEGWHGANTLGEELFVFDFVPRPDLLDAWARGRSQVIDERGWPRTVESIWQPAEGGRDRLLRVDVHECRSRAEAHEFLVHLLANFQSPAVEPSAETNLGDVGVRGLGGRAAVFARANLVVSVRNAGPEVVEVEDAAGRVDSELVSRPQGRSDIVPRIERFAIAPPAIEGARPALEVEVVDPLGREVWLKLFTGDAPVSRDEGTFVLGRSHSHPVEATLFAINENGGVASATVTWPGREGETQSH